MSAFLKSLWEKVKSEPAMVVAVVVAVVVQVAGAFHVVIDSAGLKEAVEPLVLGLLTRQFVSPARKVGK